MDQQENKVKVTLCMIVKDESAVILRALKSVRHLVDYYCICDTGSTDGTPTLIEEYLDENDLEGIVYSDTWKDFGYNRTACFKVGKETFGDADYLMTLDADEVMAPWDEVPLLDKLIVSIPPLVGDMIYIKTCYGANSYYRAGFFKASLDWKWVGVVHEYPYCPDSSDVRTLCNICNVPTPDGARSKNPDKYLDDARLFEKALEEDPENSRSWFYLAQSYVDAGRPADALVPIKNAAKYAAWDEEKFVSLLRIARYKRNSGISFEEVVGDYLTAYEYAPHRVEPLYDIISYYRGKDNFETASLFLEKALAIPYPENCILFVESSVYEWRLQDEASLVYFYTGKPEVALAIVELILGKKSVPFGDRERIKNNMKLFRESAGESCCTEPEKSIVL